jgi:hypothetical protein
MGGLFAHGIDRLIERLYINICSNFDFPSNIFMFGFSRGAVVARALAGLISKCGVLRAEEIHAFPEIYRIYRKNGLEPSDKITLEKHCYLGVKIKFLGVFDTVYGGLHRGRTFRKHLHFASSELALPSAVEFGAQILAMDEDRFLFRPLLWTSCDVQQRMVQCWMPGVHGDVGGTTGSSIGDAALLTMINLANEHTSLFFAEDYRDTTFGSPDFHLRRLKSDVQRHLPNAKISRNRVWSRSPFRKLFKRKHGSRDACLHPVAQYLNERVIEIDHRKQARYTIGNGFTNRDDVEPQATLLAKATTFMKGLA